jgi:hypothetical protein
VISANYTISRKSPLKLHNAKISRSKVNIDADMGVWVREWCSDIGTGANSFFYQDGTYHLFTLGPSIITLLLISRCSHVLRFHKSRLVHVFVMMCIVRAKNHLCHIKGYNHNVMLFTGGYMYNVMYMYMYTIKKCWTLQFLDLWLTLTFSGTEL